MKRIWLYLILLVLALAIVWLSNPSAPPPREAIDDAPAAEPAPVEEIDRQAHYSSRDDVARYLFAYGELPVNFITKQAARDLGWVAEKGNLWQVTEQYSIGGDRFHNREKLLPDAPGRLWYECDIDYQGGRRGAKRLVYSNDGLIYYTDDHYESFEQIRQEDL